MPTIDTEVATPPPVLNAHLSFNVDALATLKRGSTVALVRSGFWRNIGQSWLVTAAAGALVRSCPTTVATNERLESRSTVVAKTAGMPVRSDAGRANPCLAPVTTWCEVGHLATLNRILISVMTQR